MRADEFITENLRKWFKEKWVRFGPDGKIRGDCARGSDSEGKPKCLPQSKAHALGKKGRKYAASKKRREDPNPERRGKAKNVATKKKSNEDVMESAKRCMQCGMTNCSCPAGSCKCKPIKGWIPGKGFQKKGMAEGLNEAAGGNYLYHATGEDGLKGILSSGSIQAAAGPQTATKAQTKLPTVSVTRDWNYARGGAGASDTGIGRAAVLVLDRNAIESNFKTLGTSQSQDVRGAAFATKQQLARYSANATKFPDTNKDGVVSPEERAAMDPDQRLRYLSPKAGGEFEEAVVVPKGSLPLKATLVGFWVNPKSELMKDPTIMNDPRRLDMVRPNTFVKANQKQSVAEEQLDELKCWSGYTRVKGVPAGAPGSCKKKTKEGVEDDKCPHCGGELVSEDMLNEKKDACYYKVKSRYKVWPSAYASGALVKCRKKGAKNWGKSTTKENKGLPMPGTYEEEYDMFKRKGPERITAMTSESEELQEKWSEKYKRSINCNNPKGFSQKAHCQGRKKK